MVGRSGYPYESPIFPGDSSHTTAGNSSSSGSPVLKFTLGWNTLVSKLTWQIPKRETAEDGTTKGPSKKESDLEKMWGYRSSLPTHHVRINTKARTTGPLRRRFFAQQLITHFNNVSTKNWHLKTFKIGNHHVLMGKSPFFMGKSPFLDGEIMGYPRTIKHGFLENGLGLHRFLSAQRFQPLPWPP